MKGKKITHFLNRGGTLLSRLLISISLLCGVLPTTTTAVFAEGETTTVDTEGSGTSTQADTSVYDAYKVESVTPKGVTFDLFDYCTTTKVDESGNTVADWDASDKASWNESWASQGINNEHALVFSKNMTSYGFDGNKWTEKGGAPYKNIVEKELVNGYPELNETTTSSSESLAYLFNPLVSNDYKKSYSNVTGLLQLSNGYYYYSSHQNIKDTISGLDDSVTTGNFASYNKNTNSFDLYNTWAVKNNGTSPTGQFFPFNTADQVFAISNDTLTQKDIKSVADYINHYFGLHMKSYFVQPKDGKTNNKNMVFEFSGDDDVWIYVDGALVGDLGGIHDECSISIDFATGLVTIKQNLNGKNSSIATGKVVRQTDLKTLYDEAGVTLAGSSWVKTTNTYTDTENGQTKYSYTFSENTYHTLDMFYMERGNTDSNLSLKFNLVPPPESDIVKVNQAGIAVAGASFELYATDSSYKVASDANPIAKGSTDINGNLVLTDVNNNNTLINFDNRYITNRSTGEYYVLKETEAPSGYRAMNDDAKLHYIRNSGIGSGVLECDNVWDSGLWAGPKEQVTIQNVNNLVNTDGTSVGFDKSQNKLYAVICKRTANVGTAAPSETDDWVAISGDILDGLETKSLSELTSTSGNASYLHELEENVEGKYTVTIEDMPGDIEEYYHWVSSEYDSTKQAAELAEALKKVEYTVSFYVSDSSGTLTRISATQNANEITRQFGTRLYITDVRNSLVVQKVDWKTSNDASIEGRNLGISGATFSLYKEDQVTTDSEGKLVLKDGATAYLTRKTSNLKKGENGSTITITGAAVFTYLPQGVYYLKETTAPKTTTADYTINDQLVKVIVDKDGVYAYAGDENVEDGVSTMSGVGTLIDSMAQFGTNKSIDNTLTDIKATKMSGTLGEDGKSFTAWSETGETKYLTASDVQPASTEEGEKVLEYQVNTAVSGQSTETKNSFKSTSGWTRTKIQQDITSYEGETAIKQDLEDKDVTHLFSRTVFVQVGNKVDITDKLSGPSVTKTVTGNWSGSEEFTFTLSARGENAEALLARSENADYKTTKTIKLADGAKSGTVSFGDLIFPAEAKTYTFRIEETAGDKAQMVYDGTTYLATAKVSKKKNENNEDQWYVDWTYSTLEGTTETATALTSASFTNRYIESVTIEDAFKVEKKVSGTGASWDTETYQFELKAITNGAPMPENSTITIAKNSDGSLTNTGNFGSITYTKAGDYVYDVQEVIPSQSEREPGMTYSAAIYRITVKVKEAEGRLSVASTTYTKLKEDSGAETSTTGVTASDLSFTNTYTAGQDTWTPRIKKSYTDTSNGYSMLDMVNAGNFKFTLTADSSDAPMPAGQVGGSYTATMNNVSRAEMTYITYDSDDIGKTYTYTLKEENTSVANMTYDGSYYKVTVVVTGPTEEKPNEKVQATVTYQKYDSNNNPVGSSFERGTGEEKNPSFENTYDPEDTTATFNVSKTLTGRSWDDDDNVGFTFGLYPVKDDTPMPSDAKTDASGNKYAELTIYKPDSKAEDQTTNTGSFSSITYDKVGTYQYTITENADRRWLEFDESVYLVTVNVTLDKESGKLVATTSMSKIVKESNSENSNNTSSENITTASFTNIYNPPKETTLNGAINLRVRKKVETTDKWEAGEKFKFKIEAVTSNAPLPSVTEIELTPTAANQTVMANFGDITYTSEYITISKVGESQTFEYKIIEVTPGNKTDYMTYDSTEYHVTVTVTLDKDEGYVITSSVMTKGTGSDATKVEYADFVNKYNEPDPVTLDGKTNLKVSKTVTNEGKNEWYKDESYTFKISAVGETVTPDTPLPENTTIKLEKPESGNVKEWYFGDITFTKAGNYNYTITEVAPDNKTKYMTYDSTIYDVLVEVTPNEKQTELEAKCTITKHVSGTAGSGENSATAETTTTEQKASFTNTYKTPEGTDLVGSTYLNVSKNYVNEDESSHTWEDDDQFIFELTAESAKDGEGKAIAKNEIPMPKDENGNVENILTLGKDYTSGNFYNITYTKDGTYEYTITEQKGSDPSVTYDETNKYTVTVTVTSATGDQKFTVTSVMKDKDGNVVEKDENKKLTATFSNKYKAPTPTSTNLRVTKTLHGLSWEDTRSSFIFTLTADDENYPMPVETERTITLTKDSTSSETSDSVKNGKFGSITYTEVGTYTYTIKEQVPEDSYKIANMVYDERENHVTVEVTLNADNTLSANATYTFSTDGSASTDSAYFTNTYKNPGTLDGKSYLKVSKVLSGREWNDEQYTFVLEPENDTNPMPLNEDRSIANTITLTKDNQSGYFGNISYDTEGVYNYTITEQPSEVYDPYTEYDASAYNVKVTVEYNEKNYKYDVTSVMTKADGTNVSDNVASFTNINKKYELDGSTYLQVEKELAGRAWNDSDTFTFVLNPVSGTLTDGTAVTDVPMPETNTVTLTKPSEDSDENDTQRGSFGNIVYASAGEYHYTISEVLPTYREQNMFYDESTYDVSVIVNVNGDGTYSFTTTMTRNDGTVAPHGRAVFYNEYKEPEKGELPGDEYLHVSKVLTGRDWLDTDEFAFTITADETGNPLPEDTTIHLTKERQDAGFEYITYDHEGVYHYTISEVNTHIKNVTYDAEKYHVTVTVTYNEASHIYDVTSVMTKDDGTEVSEAVFTNTYKSPKPSGGDSDSTDSSKKSEEYNPVDTSDSNNLALFGGMLIISLACMSVMFVYRRKYNK